MARLMEDHGDQWPVFYLVGCYARASDEFRAASTLRSPTVVAAVQAALSISKQLAVSYSGLLLTMDLFPQVRCRHACVSSGHCPWTSLLAHSKADPRYHFAKVPRADVWRCVAAAPCSGSTRRAAVAGRSGRSQRAGAPGCTAAAAAVPGGACGPPGG